VDAAQNEHERWMQLKTSMKGGCSSKRAEGECSSNEHVSGCISDERGGWMPLE